MPNPRRRELPDDLPERLRPEAICQAARELVALVDDRRPERFYVRGPDWRMATTALLARMAGLIQSLVALAKNGRPSDHALLWRALYEHVVTFCWVLIDPESHSERWAARAEYQRMKLHHDTARYGVQLLTEDEISAAKAGKGIPSLHDRAKAVDKYWGERAPGFRPSSTSGTTGLLTVAGMYVALYRVASRSEHAQLDALDSCIDTSGHPWRVLPENDPSMLWLGLSVPLFAMALSVSAQRLGWPDEAAPLRICDEMYASVLADEST